MVATLKIRAPFDGTVTSKDIHPGEWAASGTPLFTMANLASRTIEIMVDESDDSLVKVGQSVELSSDAYPDRSWKEHVLSVAPALKREETENSVKVRLSYGSRAPDLKLGQQVDAKLQIAHHDHIFKVPFDCIITRDGKPMVAAVNNGRLTFIHVETGIEDMVSVEIVKGVHDGEKIVEPEGKHLEAGQKVTIVQQIPR